MKKVLSQQEIDSLINAISSGEVAAEELEKEEEQQRVKNYDFRRPNKLSKDHISAIKSIYDNYARIVSNILSNQIRETVELKVASIEQVSYGEFNRSIPNPTLMAIFRMEPMPGSMIVETHPQFGFQMVDLLCGGTLHRNVELREFTEIEINILRDVLASIIEVNRSAWEDFMPVEPVLDGLETNPKLNQTLSYGEPVVLVTFKTLVGEESGLMNLCIPYRALDRNLDKLHTNHFRAMDKLIHGERHRSDIEATIADSRVALSVELGRTVITVEDFMDLRCGDVLQLGTGTGDPMRLYVENRHHLYVQPGLLGKKLAVQVIEPAGKDVE